MRKLILALAVAASSVLIAPSAANAAPPTAPTNVTARAGVNQATVTWSPATDADGRRITYIATSTPGSFACATTDNSCVVPGLSNGQSYTFVVTASVPATGGTETNASQPTAPVTPRLDTEAPKLVSLTADRDRVPSTGGTFIVDLRITDDLSGFRSTPQTGRPPAGPAISVSGADGRTVAFAPPNQRISGDDYDGTYRYTVVVPSGTRPGLAGVSVASALDRAGNRTNSYPLGAWVSIGTAAAPTGVTATAAPGRNARVTWTGPEDDGGNLVTGYTITEAHSGRTFNTNPSTTSFDVTLDDHPADIPLVYAVTADNAGGPSKPGTSEPLTLPATAPGTPSKPLVVAGDQTLSVGWTHAPTGGGTVLESTATATPSGRTCTADPTVRTCVISGLTNGTAYTVTVTTTTTVGTSTPSRPSDEATPQGAPVTMNAPIATPGNGRTAVTWEAADPNGSPVTGYTVTAAPGGQTCSTDGTVRTCDITGLTNGTAYTFTVTATNAIGSSTPSAPSAPATPRAPVVVKPKPKPVPVVKPGQVAKPKAKAGKKSAKVTWKAPKAGSSPITTYRITASNGKKMTVRGNLRSVTFKGLKKGKKYTFTITAISKAGTGKASAKSAAVKVK